MDCLDVRDRLADYVLGGCAPEEAAAVRRHLEWCAGCRKELAELEEGVATVGWSLDPVRPPEDLEERVVDAVAEAAGARRTERRRFRLVTAVAVLATFLAVGAVGWSMAMAGRLGQAQAEAREATGEASRLSEFLRSVGGQRILPARLSPTEEGAGGGRALVYTTGGRGSDWALVLVDGLPSDRGPYTASLIHGSGIEVPVGRLAKSGPSQLSAYRFFVQDLAGFRDVVVTDRLGAVVLHGAVQSPGAG